ncbi:MAG: phage portal protein [Janthinobacterium lividum]
MSIIDTLGSALANWSAPVHAAVVQNSTPLPLIGRGSDEWGALTGNFGNGNALSETEAMTVSSIYGCVNLISGATAAMPLLQYERTSDAPKRFEDEFDDVLNQQMCPRWGAPSGWEFIMQNLLLPGDGYARILRDGLGKVTGLEPIRHNRVTPYVTPDGARLVYAVAPDPFVIIGAPAGVMQVYDQDDMLHIPGFGFDGLRGMSPLRFALRVAGSVANETQKYAADFFANSARGDYYLKTESTLDDKQFLQMQEQLREQHGVTGQRHLPMILTGGLSVAALTLPFEDIQMLATRQFQVEEICRIYGVPPFMVGHTDKSTSWGSGVEAMGTGFVRYALRQHLVKVEAEINRKIYRTRKRFVEFDTHSLEKADMAVLFAAFRIAIGRSGEAGFMSTNDARRALRLPTTPDGDKLAVATPPAAVKPAIDPTKEP